MTRREDRIVSLQTRVVRVLREKIGLHEQFATPIAQAAVHELFRDLTGERIYISQKDPELRSKIVAEFTGANRDEICLRYKISKATFYRYLRLGK